MPRRLVWAVAGTVVLLAVVVGVIMTAGGHTKTAAATQPGLVVHGSTLAATLVNVPQGVGVYLTGVSGDKALDPKAHLLVLEACKTAGSVATCTFPVPSWSGPVTYAGFTTSGRMSSSITVSADGQVTGSSLNFDAGPAVGASTPAANLKLALSSPVGSVPAGTPLLATVMGIPVGDSAFLVGSATDATQGGSTILVLTPCTPDGAAGTQEQCSFKSPAFTGSLTYQVHLVGSVDLAMSAVVDPPLNQLPEVPLAAALPALMLAVVGAQVWRSLRRGGAA